MATYGGLDICINSAGITSPVPFQNDQTDGTKTWRRTINVNLLALIDCTRLEVMYPIGLFAVLGAVQQWIIV